MTTATDKVFIGTQFTFDTRAAYYYKGWNYC